jgi:hypothetical protein
MVSLGSSNELKDNGIDILYTSTIQMCEKGSAKSIVECKAVRFMNQGFSGESTSYGAEIRRNGPYFEYC